MKKTHKQKVKMARMMRSLKETKRRVDTSRGLWDSAEWRRREESKRLKVLKLMSKKNGK